MLPNKLLLSVVETFKPFSVGIIVVGSAAWGTSEMAKDLDIEVVTPNFRLLKSPDIKKARIYKLQESLKDFLSGPLALVESLRLPMFSLKFNYRGTSVGIRFLKGSLFEKVCNLDIVRLRKSISVFQYRSSSTKTFDVQRNFSGKTKSFNLICFQRGQEQIIEVPIILFDKNGWFYPGQIIDRYLSFPKILYQKKSFCRDNLTKLKKYAIERLALEKKTSLNPKKLVFDNCLLRKDRIPRELLLVFRREAVNSNI